jgi:23S rRNA (guanosine2251-2'-O)-methyltransferase
MKEMVVLLHNIRSAHNVGSIFRTADAAGVSIMYLTGYTPRPIDRFGRPQKDIAKTALGAETSVPWESAPRPTKVLKKMRESGWHIVGLEQDERAGDYRTFRAKNKTMLVVGNEVRGLSPELRRACDALIEIPMYGTKESLNVSVAAGIALFALRG